LPPSGVCGNLPCARFVIGGRHGRARWCREEGHTEGSHASGASTRRKVQVRAGQVHGWDDSRGPGHGNQTGVGHEHRQDADPQCIAQHRSGQVDSGEAGCRKDQHRRQNLSDQGGIREGGEGGRKARQCHPDLVCQDRDRRPCGRVHERSGGQGGEIDDAGQDGEIGGQDGGEVRGEDFGTEQDHRHETAGATKVCARGVAGKESDRTQNRRDIRGEGA